MVNFKKLRQMIEVKGNGNIVSREVNVSSFVRLHIACKGIVELHQSDEEKVVFEADENLHEFFTAANAGRTLYVTTETKLRKPVYTKALVKIFIRQMDKLHVRNDHGNLICPSLLTFSQPLEINVQSIGNTDLHIAAPSLKISCQAQGNTSLKGSCEILDIKNQSNGNFDSSQLNAGELTIRNMANGNVLVRAGKTIQLSHYGNGYIHYYGDAVVKDVKHYGHGEVKHINEKVV
ncbi:MAG: GIN domain-containing protein [Bacteroidia bacterium]